MARARTTELCDADDEQDQRACDAQPDEGVSPATHHTGRVARARHRLVRSSAAWDPSAVARRSPAAASAHRDTRAAELVLRFADGVFAVVEDRGAEDRPGPALD